jgi:nondiscriminating aspartyl-tRNA synthetase
LNDVLREEEIGGWRRTHYSSEINSSLEDREVIIMGWVSSKRDHGNILFIIVRDRYGEIQVIAKKSECSTLLFGQMEQIKEHTSLAIRGTIRPQDKAPGGFEIIPLELKAFSIARKAAPFMTQNKTPIGIDTRLDLRAIDLRRNVPIKTRVYRSKYTKNDCYRYRGRCGTISDILLRQRSILGSKSTIV